MNRIIFLLVLASSFAFSANSQNVNTLTLTDAIMLSREQSPASKQAETRKKNSYWQYRTYKSDYNPQLVLRGNLPGYNRDYFSNTLDDGTIVFQSREQINSSLNLGLDQPIAFTGGNISVNTNLNYFNDIQQNLDRYNTTVVNIKLDQPLFGYNPLKWDKRTEPLRYEESKRNYVEQMEFVSRESVRYFFDFLDSQINYQIADFNLVNNDTIYKIEEGRYNIGKTSKDKLLQVELQLLRSQQDVTQAQLDLQTASQKLRAYLAIKSSDTLQLVMPESIPKFDILMQDALMYAKLNRSAYIQFERSRIEAERDVAQARKQRFGANLVASYGLNTASDDFDDAYSNPNDQQRLDIGLAVPILDWGRNKARIQTALANQQLNEYVLEQDIQNFEQEIITLVRRFEVLRIQLKIVKKADEVADERYKVAQNRYLIGKVEITDLNIALNEKDAAKRSYIKALRDFWVAYFDLRRLTLYDFVNKELLYKPE